MLILGILAAIALPAFFNQKTRRATQRRRSTSTRAQVAMETCSTEASDGSYAACKKANIEAIEPTLSSAEGLAVFGPKPTNTAETPTAAGYKIEVEGTSGWFAVERNNGALTFSCEATTGEGGCPVGGNWNN